MKVLRALLVLLALFAIVPTQTGGALAVDELGLGVAVDDRVAEIVGQGEKRQPAAPVHHASFAAPDDGTAAAGLLADPPRLATLAPSCLEGLDLVPSSAGSRLDRPPKSV